MERQEEPRELTEEEVATIFEVLEEKREFLQTNAQRAIVRLTVYQKSPDCAVLFEKAKKTVNKNIIKIGKLDRILKKLKA